MNESFINFEYYFYNNSAIENKSAHFNLSLNTYLLEEEYCNSTLGTGIATPEWEVLTTFIILSIVILGTIFGNVLVILGVFTHRPLRIVQNFFIVSLAAADLAVAILVMPLNVAYSSFGKWLWGKSLCKIWLTCDIMSCTSSILNLCAIALDRYYAITDPINYAGKRTLKRVMAQIAGVWALSLVISSPPLVGWNDWPEEFTIDTPCQLTSERGYVIYSSLGSFFIPLVIMTIVYVKIFLAARSRLRKRTLTALITKPVIAKDTKEKNVIDNDSDSGDSIKRYQRKAFMDIKKNFFMPLLLMQSDSKMAHKVETEIETSTQTARCKSIRKNNRGSSMRSSNRKKRCEKPLLASVSSSGDVVNQFIEQKQKISVSKERRAARTLGIIMGVFVICWLPFFLMYITLSFCYWCCPSNRLINLITWLGYANSAVNPLIYTTFNMDFRKAFKNLLGFR